MDVSGMHDRESYEAMQRHYLEEQGLHYDSISFEDVLQHPKWFVAHNESFDSFIQIVRTLKIRDASNKRKKNRGLFVAEGLMFPGKVPCILKWYRGSAFTIEDEMGIYDKLSSLNIDPPLVVKHSNQYTLWGEPILVMSKMQTIQNHDHEFQIGIDILQALKVIHQYLFHSDMKLANIAKYIYADGTSRYYLIDFGRSTIREKGQRDYHDRFVHTKGHAKPENYFRITARIELEELIRELIIQHRERTGAEKGPKKLYRCLKYIRKLGHYPESQAYDDLIGMLS